MQDPDNREVGAIRHSKFTGRKAGRHISGCSDAEGTTPCWAHPKTAGPACTPWRRRLAGRQAARRSAAGCCSARLRWPPGRAHTNLVGSSEAGLKGRRCAGCAGCATVCYCSAHCAKLDWPRHKPACRLLAAGSGDSGGCTNIAAAGLRDGSAAGNGGRRSPAAASTTAPGARHGGSSRRGGGGQPVCVYM